jgi:6,7-dimethyl-8-ribityllumazine synthase
VSSQKSGNRISAVSARGLKFVLVVSKYNEPITTRLLEGARSCLERHGAISSGVLIVSCPGAFELPQVAGLLAAQGRWDAIICLGAVIRGETPHFDYVAAEAARGIQSVAIHFGLPVAFGILTTNNVRQARERSGGKHGNKGWEAALTAIEMAQLFKKLKRSRRAM